MYVSKVLKNKSVHMGFSLICMYLKFEKIKSIHLSLVNCVSTRSETSNLIDVGWRINLNIF